MKPVQLRRGGGGPIDGPVQDLADLEAGIARVLVPRRRIAERVAELGRRIAADLDGRPITLAAVMTGAMIFAADLIRHLPIMMRIHLVSMSSYPGEATESEGVRRLSPRPAGLDGRTVLIVDDILDSGRTLALTVRDALAAGAADVRTCVLLSKPAGLRAADGVAKADYVGFEIPDEFVVGYGLDYDDYYRNLPDIAVLANVSRRRP